MYRVIEKKFCTKKGILTIGGTAVLVLLITGSVYFTSGKSRLNVDPERTISEIKQEPFQEFIPVTVQRFKEI